MTDDNTPSSFTFEELVLFFVAEQFEGLEPRAQLAKAHITIQAFVDETKGTNSLLFPTKNEGRVDVLIEALHNAGCEFNVSRHQQPNKDPIVTIGFSSSEDKRAFGERYVAKHQELLVGQNRVDRYTEYRKASQIIVKDEGITPPPSGGVARNSDDEDACIMPPQNWLGAELPWQGYDDDAPHGPDYDPKEMGQLKQVVFFLAKQFKETIENGVPQSELDQLTTHISRTYQNDSLRLAIPINKTRGYDVFAENLYDLLNDGMRDIDMKGHYKNGEIIDMARGATNQPIESLNHIEIVFPNPASKTRLLGTLARVMHSDDIDHEFAGYLRQSEARTPAEQQTYVAKIRSRAERALGDDLFEALSHLEQDTLRPVNVTLHSQIIFEDMLGKPKGKVDISLRSEFSKAQQQIAAVMQSPSNSRPKDDLLNTLGSIRAMLHNDRESMSCFLSSIDEAPHTIPATNDIDALADRVGHHIDWVDAAAERIEAASEMLHKKSIEDDRGQSI